MDLAAARKREWGQKCERGIRQLADSPFLDLAVDAVAASAGRCQRCAPQERCGHSTILVSAQRSHAPPLAHFLFTPPRDELQDSVVSWFRDSPLRRGSGFSLRAVARSNGFPLPWSEEIAFPGAPLRTQVFPLCRGERVPEDRGQVGGCMSRPP